jgi:hypothetical protein
VCAKRTFPFRFFFKCTNECVTATLTILFFIFLLKLIFSEFWQIIAKKIRRNKKFKGKRAEEEERIVWKEVPSATILLRLCQPEIGVSEFEPPAIYSFFLSIFDFAQFSSSRESESQISKQQKI